LIKAIDLFYKELEFQRENKASVYLVDNETGRTLTPIDESCIYTPSDYIDENGDTKHAQPILHPGISSSIIMHKYESNKHDNLIKSVEEKSKFAAIHAVDPNQILEMTKNRLNKNIEITDNFVGEEIELGIGKENIAGMEQAPNPGFHRVAVFSSLLANKINFLLKNGGKCEIKEIKESKNSKERWYTVKLKTLSTASTSKQH
jgi:hypothetical protein